MRLSLELTCMQCGNSISLCPTVQGEYGLYEAVQEIKMKKDELAIRDK